jgi:predicted RNA-binding protein
MLIFIKNDKEELIMEAVDKIEPLDTENFRIVSIFGEQKNIRGKIKQLNLLNHRILFEAVG